MKHYDHIKIEKKWQKVWESKKPNKVKEDKKKKKFYALIEFPYPSGDGLHVGHIRSNTAMDIVSRKRRREGYNVLYPIGWDAFGLPTENYAIKTGIQPAIVTKKNTDTFRKQLKSLGFSFDWSREINTTDPKYYKWTQWIFLQFFKKGLAYKKKMTINWCPKDLIGLANEEVINGCCERCGTQVEQKEKEQWMLAITKYADRLAKDLDDTDYLEKIKIYQRNWIGKSEGAEIGFELKLKTPKNFVILHGFTATPDDDFHPWLKKKLEDSGYKVQIPKLPNTDKPTEEEQVNFVLKNVKFDENTVLIGHSLGSVVAMKVLEKLNQQISGLITVGGFIDVKFRDYDRNFHKTFNWDFDFEKIKSNVKFIKVLQDKNDDAITDGQAKRLAMALGVNVEECIANESHFTAKEEPEILKSVTPLIKVYTTRPDTLFGVTYIVIAPEHEYIKELISNSNNKDEIEKYISNVRKKTNIERTDAKSDKTGIEIKGIKAINPANNEEVSVWIADYVLADYGTGAVMAVPAHDERDWEFAKKYNLNIKEVILPNIIDIRNPPIAGKKIVERRNVHPIVLDKKTGKYLALKWKNFDWTTFPMGGVEEGEDIVDAARREVKEETGFINLKLIKVLDGNVRAEYFAAHKDQNRVSYTTAVMFELEDYTKVEIDQKEKDAHEIIWLDRNQLNYETMTHAEIEMWNEKMSKSNSAYTGEGILINSEQFNNKSSDLIKKNITQFVNGKWVTKFKLRDWVFSRQRYWGEPIPIVHCEKCGMVAVPEKELPLTLPKVKNYAPTGTGESPLAGISKWVNTKCPKCKGKAKRETDTMPQWAGSSWYYLRYMDSKNNKVFADKKNLKYWGQVDWYNGGMEHATLHLLYSRFWHKFLFDLGLVPTSEPYKKRTSHGMILAEGGEKMSKSKGNVINPDSLVKTVGADSLRIHEMFMGPFDQAIAWDTNTIAGSRRFIERVWKLQEKIIDVVLSATVSESSLATGSATKRDLLSPREHDILETHIHKTIKKVTEDIEAMRFNTAISSMMILLNEFEKQESINKKDYEILIQLLAPFAPHITEEIWNSLGNKKSIHESIWPKYDERKMIQSVSKITIQINGKVRGTIESTTDMNEDEIKRRVLDLPEIKKWVNNSIIKKVIYIKGKLINLVI